MRLERGRMTRVGAMDGGSMTTARVVEVAGMKKKNEENEKKEKLKKENNVIYYVDSNKLNDMAACIFCSTPSLLMRQFRHAKTYMTLPYVEFNKRITFYSI